MVCRLGSHSPICTPPPRVSILEGIYCDHTLLPSDSLRTGLYIFSALAAEGTVDLWSSPALVLLVLFLNPNFGPTKEKQIHDEHLCASGSVVSL